MAFNLAEDATKKTLIKPLPNFIPNREEYKALMDNGLAYAKEFHLIPGVSLTKGQMAALTSDMVWLENTTVTVGGRTYTVLYPRVYLKPSSLRLTDDGSLVSGNTLTVDIEMCL